MRRHSILIISAAIAVAIAIIVAFASINFQSSSMPISDADLQRKTGELPEVKVFLSKYPDSNIQFHQDEKIRTIDYATSLRDNENSNFLYLLKINIVADKMSGEPQSVTFTCTKTDASNSTSYSVSENIEEEIRAENCLRS